MTAINEQRDSSEMDSAKKPQVPATGAAASYATFMRVKGGISDGALQAAGLPPARDLTYEAYLAAFGPAKATEKDDLDLLRGERAAPVAGKEETPGPPPLGRRLVLAEAPDGSWRIVNDPDRPIYSPPPPRRYVAKTVAMLMGIAVAFVVAALINAVYLRQQQPAVAGQTTDPVIETPDTAAISAAEVPEIDTASGGPADRPSPAAEQRVQAEALPALPALPVEAVATVPIDKPIPPEADMPSKSVPAPSRQVKPADLPKSTPTARQQRLPNSTKPASMP